MPRFSANLGLLWSDLPLPDRVRAAAEAGFEAVECHWPYDVDACELKAVLAHFGLPLVCLNTPCGDIGAGEFGLAAVPGRRGEAISGIDLAVDYAVAAGARNIHVMAGICDDSSGARAAFLDVLGHAVRRAEVHGLGILIEPINRIDRPGYFLHRVEQAREIIDELDTPSLRMMFDCYHVQKTQGNLTAQLVENLGVIGHIQVAAVPDRSEPDHGEIDYSWLFEYIDTLGYGGLVGAEYVPRADTAQGLDWFARWRPGGPGKGADPRISNNRESHE